MIRFENVTKRYADGTTAVDDLSFEVGEGELVTLVGPSGCGKTTTMKMVNRLIEPTGGRIFLDGDDISGIDPVQLRRRIGYVIQQTGLFPHMRVLETVTLAPRTARGLSVSDVLHGEGHHRVVARLQPDSTRVQLRAMLRSTAVGDVGIMFPLVTSVDEMAEALAWPETVALGEPTSTNEA